MLLTLADIIGFALFLMSAYVELRVRNNISGIMPDAIAIETLAMAGLIGSCYIFWQRIRRDAVKTLM